MDDKIAWADIPPGHVGPLTEETQQEETVVAEPVSAPIVAEADDDSVSSMELDSSGPLILKSFQPSKMKLFIV